MTERGSSRIKVQAERLVIVPKLPDLQLAIIFDELPDLRQELECGFQRFRRHRRKVSGRHGR